MQMKIKGKTNLKTSNEVVINNKEFNGLKNDNTITFYDDDIKVNITLGDEVMLKRSNDDYEIMLTFNERSSMERDTWLQSIACSCCHHQEQTQVIRPQE